MLGAGARVGFGDRVGGSVRIRLTYVRRVSESGQRHQRLRVRLCVRGSAV